MDLENSFIILIIFGIFGFLISKTIGFNPYRIFSDLSSAFIILIIIVMFFPIMINPEQSIDTIPSFIQFFVAILPGVVIGDAAGSVVAALTGTS